MAYDPLNLSALQIGIESGGHQFDPKTGKPLTSKKGAIGVAQVMPGTGPEAAALAGVPWDENRYKNDRDYNLQLGDAYQGHLNKIFNGNKLAATAAYQSGPNRVLELRQKYGDSWAQHLGPDGKAYVKRILGVDVGGAPNQDMTQVAADALGIPLKSYSTDKPGANENPSNLTPIASPDSVDSAGIKTRANAAVTASDKYTQYLNGAIQPLIDNAKATEERSQAIVDTKRNIVNDFATREAALETRIKPLMARREAVAAKLAALDSMNPLERRLKAVFNPNEYDPRMLRGQLERATQAMSVYEGDYKELNELRSSVAAASVDAESQDVATLNLHRENILNQGALLGQVAGAVSANASAQLLPLSIQADTLKLQEATKQSMLGKLTGEKIVSLYQQAQQSPDGTAMVDGVKLTVGELQNAAQQAQSQDLTLRSMVNAFRTSDLHTTDALESQYIDHMTSEQITEALKNGGKVKTPNGKDYQLSMTKLATASQSAQQLRDQHIENVVNSTATGLADTSLRSLTSQLNSSQARLIDIFGRVPGEYEALKTQTFASYQAWRKGFDALAGQPDAQHAYVAKSMPMIQGMQTSYENTITSIAKRWGGGKQELADVAENYLRGNPLSGDSATRGLVSLARSGMPTGSRLTGPALQAFQIAQATVREWDNPQQGDSLDALLKGTSKKETDLQRLVQSRVGAVYADAMTDSIMGDLPQVARSVRDPQNPGRLHPFARVSREDFLMSIRHGDAQAYQVMSNKMGVDPNTVKRIFTSGTDSPEWKALAQKKGWGNEQFTNLYQTLQTTSMAETLSALDASHSSAPGFSPAKAFIDFLQTPEVANRVNQAVSAYGQSNFGAYLISNSSGGGFKDSWDGYVDSINATYQQLHSKELQQRIKQQRSITGDPWVRINAVNRAAGLTPQESQVLMKSIKPYVNLSDVVDPTNSMSESGVIASVGTNNSNQFDQIANVMRNRPIENPEVEKLRKKVASQWDTMDALVGTIFDSVSN